MELTLKEKTIKFYYLEQSDIDDIEAQIKDYEKKHGKLSLESLYTSSIYSDITSVLENYIIDVIIQNEDEDESDVLVSLSLEGQTYEIAQECEKEITNYLLFRFIELAVNNL